MAKKLYYTDWLVAVYMAREFGVDCVHPYSGKNAEPMGATFDDVMQSRIIETVNKKGRIQLHYDSHHIFEPRHADICFFETYQNDEDLVFFYDETDPWPNTELVIIQRDKKAFFMPEIQEE